MNSEIFSLLKSSATLLSELALYLTDKSINNKGLSNREDNFRKECMNLSIVLTRQVLKYGKQI